MMDNKNNNPSPNSSDPAESAKNTGAENGGRATDGRPNTGDGNGELPDIKNISNFNAENIKEDSPKKDPLKEDLPTDKRESSANPEAGDNSQKDNQESKSNSEPENPESGDDSPKDEESSKSGSDSDFDSSQMPMQYWQDDQADAQKSQASPENNSDTDQGKADQTKADKTPSPFSPNEEQAEEDDEAGMSLLDHLNELRRRLVKACIAVAVCFGICWAFVDPLFDVLVNPLMAVLPEGTHAQYTTLPEAFFTRMYIAFVASIFLASPVIFYQIWAFVAPGLYDEEKRYIIPIAFLSAVFFVCGAIFCYYIVFPFAFNFFISYSTPEIVITPKVSDYLSFVIKLLFAFGLIFEMPIFTLFLARLGIVTAAMMRKARRYAIVAIFILAAILTPPDVVSQLLMACPMLLLYELSIGVAVVFGRKKKKSADSAANDDHESSDTTDPSENG